MRRASVGPLHADDRRAARDGDRASATPGVRVFPLERATVRARVRVHDQRRLDREAQGGADPRDRPRAGRTIAARAGRRWSSAGRRSSTPAAGRSVRADPRRLHQQAVRRQRPGDARHRAVAVRHEPGRAPGRREHRRRGPRASPAGDQPHPPLRRDPQRGRAGRAEVGHHVRVRQATTSISCSPAASATTARCRR